MGSLLPAGGGEVERDRSPIGREYVDAWREEGRDEDDDVGPGTLSEA